MTQAHAQTLFVFDSMLANPNRAAETTTKIPASAAVEGLPAAWASAGAPSEAGESVGRSKNMSETTVIAHFGYVNVALSQTNIFRRISFIRPL